MIYDALARFADKHDPGAMTQNVAERFGDVIDRHGNMYAIYPNTTQNTDIGDGHIVYATFVFHGTWAGVTGSDITMDLEHADNAPGAASTGVGGTNRGVVARLTRPFTATQTNVGFALPIPQGVNTRRYLGVSIVSDTGRSDGQNGTISAFITDNPWNIRNIYVEGRNWV